MKFQVLVSESNPPLILPLISCLDWEQRQPVRPYHEFRQFLNLPGMYSCAAAYPHFPSCWLTIRTDSMNHNAEDLYRRYLQNFDPQACGPARNRPRTSAPNTSPSSSSSHPAQSSRIHLPEAASSSYVALVPSQAHPSPRPTSRTGGPQGSKTTLSTTTFASMITARRRVAPVGPSSSAAQRFDADFTQFAPQTFFHQSSFTQSGSSNPPFANEASAAQYTMSQRDISVVTAGNNSTSTFKQATFSKTGPGSVPRLLNGEFRGRNPFQGL
jgi:hypothetical protein